MSTRILAVAVVALLAACSKKTEPDPQAAPGARASPPPAASGFTARDVALATALDARLARLSLVASDAHAALSEQAQRGAARARELLPALDAARGELERALAAVGTQADRNLAERAVASARSYAEAIAAAATGRAAAAGELLRSRDAFGEAIAAYRQARSRWRVPALEGEGAERAFAEARRELERAEAALLSRTRVAPREDGHELEPATLRMTGRMAADRAKAAAASLGPTLRDAAGRYAAAEQRAFELAVGLREASDAERARLSREYHAAKADALQALADYLGAVAAR